VASPATALAALRVSPVKAFEIEALIFRAVS
jgi:hypothetical protein